MADADVVLRRADGRDADDIARVLRASLSSLDWMPAMHTQDEDRAFIRDIVLPRQAVTVAEADGRIVGFIAIRDRWVEQLYIDPTWTGRGIGGRLLDTATADAPFVQLYCFQANLRACRFYERHGFYAEASRDGSANEERLPDVLYVRRSRDCCGPWIEI